MYIIKSMFIRKFSMKNRLFYKPLLFSALALFFACDNGGGGGGGHSPGGGGGGSSHLSLPSSPNGAAVDALYGNWKAVYFRTVENEIASGYDPDIVQYQFIGREGYARIRFDKGSGCDPEGICTVSEGIGYGMVIAYFQDDRDAFERLWRYSRAASYASNGSLIHWKFYSFEKSPIGQSSATDADLDIATVLFLGYKRWGNEQMLNDAKSIAASIWNFEIEKSNNLIIPGDGGWSGRDNYNPSYFSPVAIRIFKDINPENNWQGVLDANYAWLENISANGNLVMDWADAAGQPKAPYTGVANSTYNTYYLESVRVPWRLAWDYAWYGDSRAKTILDRFARYAIDETSGDPSKIRQRYSYEGASSMGSNILTSMAQKASLCAAGLANPEFQWWLDACLPIVNETPFSATSNNGFNYFHHILQVMYAQIINGKYGGKPF
jgi:endo-1,4-beta-D-glucanase Y